MQITEPTSFWIAEQLEMDDFKYELLKEPKENINMGTWYLSYLLSLYKNEELALCAYNAGIGNVNKWLTDPECSTDGKNLHHIPFEETRLYVEKVSKFREFYKVLYHDLSTK